MKSDIVILNKAKVGGIVYDKVVIEVDGPHHFLISNQK